MQGVFYRQSTKEKADELSINGEVKNFPDGTVHIIATGSPGAIDKLVQWCHHGPRRAVVDKVVVEEKELLEFSSFRIDR